MRELPASPTHLNTAISFRAKDLVLAVRSLKVPVLLLYCSPRATDVPACFSREDLPGVCVCVGGELGIP